MNEVTTFTNVEMQTPIEIALGIDENGMTTAKKLYEFLELNPSNYSKWYKTNITENEFATENEDYFYSSLSTSEQGRGNFAQDFKLTAHFAKKLSMKGNGTRAEEAREYFTHLEEKVKEVAINRSQLSPELQMFLKMGEAMAKQELEQKRQAEKLDKLEENQKAINSALTGQIEEDFKRWVNRCLSAIAESENYTYIGSRQEKHQAIRAESYQRLNTKRPCRLEQRVKLEKGRAYEAGASKTKIDAINKLYIIENDKDLKPVYESVIREMLVAYCVEI